MRNTSRVRCSHALSGSWSRIAFTLASISPASAPAPDHSRANVPSWISRRTVAMRDSRSRSMKRAAGERSVLRGVRMEVHLPHHPDLPDLLERIGELAREVELEQHGLRRLAR